MNLEQITNTLNNEFKGEGRKLVFWYDEKQEFLLEIEGLGLENAKLLILREDELFKTKVLLEREDRETNYLIYAPFKRPKNKGNHLADTIMYSKVFLTDWISVIMQNLEIKDELRETLQKHGKFFEAKDRREKFEEFVDYFKPMTEEEIEIIMMRILTNSKIGDFEGFEDVVRILIMDINRKESKYLSEFRKYNLEEKFWEFCKLKFGYVDEKPNLTKLLIGIFLTYVSEKVKKELPKQFNEFNKKGTVVTFLSRLNNSSRYKNEFKNLASEVYSLINGDNYFKNFLPEHILELDIFDFPDEKIINWIIERITDENFSVKLQDTSIKDIIKLRKEKNIGNENLQTEYKILEYAYEGIKNTKFETCNDFVEITDSYAKKKYMIDTYYRKFCYYYDKLMENNEKYNKLLNLLEIKYTDKFLNPINIKFNELIDYKNISKKINLQRDFYKNYVEPNKNRIVVIISDALRYETAKELLYKMSKDEKMNAEMEYQLGIIPSITN